ncbi:hypothetical protein RIVM261_079530 [Rivularia sp. IAM M-261]|nr:hypothetical protein RIVM261_079530 [Rivularia sp. IAM M-261]
MYSILVLCDYQEELVARTLGAWSNGTRKVLLQLSTGGGKTVIFAAIASQFVRHQEGVLVIGVATIASCEGAEWEEVPASVRPAVLRPIAENKKRKYRGNKGFFQRFEVIQDWFDTRCDINLDEIKYAVNLMELNAREELIINTILHRTVSKIRNSSDWYDINKNMSERAGDVKKAVWDKLDALEKQKLNNWKKRYLEELEVWGTEENLIVIQKDLEACENFEMLEELWQIFNKEAIRIASKRINSDKGAVIRGWIEKVDSFSYNTMP